MQIIYDNLNYPFSESGFECRSEVILNYIDLETEGYYMLSTHMKISIKAGIVAVQERRWVDLDAAMGAIRSARDAEAETMAIFVLKACAHQKENIDAFIDAAERFAADDKNIDFVRKVVSAEFKWRAAYDTAIVEQTDAAFAAEVAAAETADTLAAQAASAVAAVVAQA
jgi:hypothetical protein